MEDSTHFAKTQNYKYQTIYNAFYGWEGNKEKENKK